MMVTGGWDSDPGGNPLGDQDDERLAEAVADLADQVRAGETVDLAVLGAGPPDRSQVIQFLPAIRLLSTLRRGPTALQAGGR